MDSKTPSTLSLQNFKLTIGHAFNPSFQEVEAEAGRSLGVGDQYGLQSEFQNGQNYIIERSCLKKKKKIQLRFLSQHLSSNEILHDIKDKKSEVTLRLNNLPQSQIQ